MQLASAPRVRSVDPTTYLPFADFSCGGESAYEQEVDAVVSLLYRGEMEYVVVRVAEDPDTNDLIGLCAVSRRRFGYTYDAAYIAVIALNGTYRGHRLPDGRRLGEFLLGDALDQIKAIWDGPPMPTTWAVVAPDNTASHNTFAYWGFERLPGQGGGYDIRYRPAGVGLSAV